MLVRTLTILILYVCCSSGLASKQSRLCGNEVWRVNFGKAKMLSSPDTSDPIICRYKIIVAEGLNIQVSFQELKVDSCCSSFKVYDASKTPFVWADARPISLPPSLGAGSAIIFPTHTIGIEYAITSSTDSSFSIRHKPVIPADGDCGQQLEAISRERTLQTPGWKTTKTPAGMKCSWEIRAREGYRVHFRIDETKIVPEKGDYLEIYEGENVLGKIAGKVDGLPTYTSESNTLRVYYHTTSAVSKGFKAHYKEVEVGLTCFNRTKVNDASTGKNVFSMGSKMECPPYSTCGVFFIRGDSNTFPGAKVDVEVGACLPAGSCEGDPCSMAPPNPAVTVTSCEASCCDEDLCNVIVPSGVKIPTKGLTCYNRTKVVLAETGAVISAQESETECSPTDACVLFFIQGTSTAYPGAKVDVEVGSCISANACGVNPCSMVPPNPNIIVSSCEASCCESDLCNFIPTKAEEPEGELLPVSPKPIRPEDMMIADAPYETTESPPFPTTQPGGSMTGGTPPYVEPPLTCYVAEVVTTFGFRVVDKVSTKTCERGEVCLTMIADATLATMNYLQAEVTIGVCSPRSDCGPAFCTKAASGFAGPGTTLDNCRASCCYKSLCNSP